MFVAAGAACSKTVEPTVVLDVGDLLGITDHFVITSGSKVRQVRTIAEEIELRVKAQGGGSPRYIEGLADARWCRWTTASSWSTCSSRRRGATTTWSDSGSMRPGWNSRALRRLASGPRSRTVATAGRDLRRCNRVLRLGGQLLVVGAIDYKARRQRAAAYLKGWMRDPSYVNRTPRTSGRDVTE